MNDIFPLNHPTATSIFPTIEWARPARPIQVVIVQMIMIWLMVSLAAATGHASKPINQPARAALDELKPSR